MANKKIYGNTKVYSATSMAMDMFKIGVEDGYLPTSEYFPNIPEIMSQARSECLKAYKDIDTWNKNKNPERYGASRLIECVNRICFYVGMGAVFHWNDNWDLLKRKGIYESLAQPRGSFYLDEYVMHLAGMDFGTLNSKKLDRDCYNARQTMIPYLLEHKDPKDLFEQMIECMMAMYYYGMVIGMSMLGMH